MEGNAADETSMHGLPATRKQVNDKGVETAAYSVATDELNSDAFRTGGRG